MRSAALPCRRIFPYLGSNESGEVEALEKNGTGCSSSYAMQQYYASIWRAEQMSHELGSMTTLFEKEGIDFMPLKGAVMRPLYPEPWMRTSADIDILFRDEDFSRACALVKAELGYAEEEEKGSHHLSFHAPTNNVHVEMHQMLFADYQTDRSVTDLLSGIWDRAFPAEGYTHLMRMSDPDFYFYHIAHMAKHLISDGGCPVRSLIDLHILDRQPMRDEPGRRELLEKAGLLTFADMMSVTAKAWLDGGSVPSEELEQFIMTGNMYGTGKNRVAMDVETNGFGRYVLRRIFLPYDNQILISRASGTQVADSPLSGGALDQSVQQKIPQQTEETDRSPAAGIQVHGH